MKKSEFFKTVGPGIAVAATGVGAGDLVAAAVAGATYGTVLVWAALAGALLKFALNEGVARWQLGSGTTLIEGWAAHLGRPVSILFIAYLLLWSFIVAGALIAACGLAAHALFGGLDVAAWGAIHAVAAAGLLRLGGYAHFERAMKIMIGLMFVVLIVCAVLVLPPLPVLLRQTLIPTVPEGSAPFVLGIIGGVGGSVTLLNYAYWMREKGWNSVADFPKARLDLTVAYALTGLFGVAVILTAAGVSPERISGNQMALEIANRLGETTGPVGKWAFLVGFWGAVFSSMLGVWQGVPYIFADFLRNWRRSREPVSTRSKPYLAYQLYLVFPPMLLLLLDRPVWIVVAYSIAGAMFMPFLAATLLYLNNRKLPANARQGAWLANGLLFAALVLFGYLMLRAVAGAFSG